MAFKEPYVAINSILTFILFLIFSYSFFYPVLAGEGLTIASSCEGLPEIYCRSRGMTRAFYQLIHLDLVKAAVFNRFALSLFIFFVIQFFARIVLSIFYQRTRDNRIVVWDSVLSAVYFVYVFSPLTFIYYWVFEK